MTILYRHTYREFFIPKNGFDHTVEAVLRCPPPALAGAGRRKQAPVAIRDITEQTKIRKGPPCSVCEKLETLPADEAAALHALLADPTWRYRALSDELAKEGHDLAPFVLSRHAKGQCAARTKLR